MNKKRLNPSFDCIYVNPSVPAGSLHEAYDYHQCLDCNHCFCLETEANREVKLQMLLKSMRGYGYLLPQTEGTSVFSLRVKYLVVWHANTKFACSDLIFYFSGCTFL